jgi:DNA-binding NtrC family response regulator
MLRSSIVLFLYRSVVLYHQPRMAINVLIVSYQPELLAPHAEALVAAGYTVNSVKNMSAALGAVGPGKYEYMVLAHTTPAGDRRRIEGEAKRRNGNIRIILFYEGQPERDVFAKAFVDIAQPPSALVECINTLAQS